MALGYTLVYGILQLINFAHGDVFALSGLFASTVIVSVLGLDTDSSVPVIIGGLLLTLLVVMPCSRSSTRRSSASPTSRCAVRPPAPLITAVGVSFIVQNIGLALYGVNYRSVPNFIPRTDASTSAGSRYSWNKLVGVIIVVPLLLLLSWFVRSTKQGKAMRAVAQDREASAMMGIDVNRTISVTFLIAGALAGAAGIVYLLQFNMRYDTGFELGLIAFTAAVLGGIGNLTGAVLGALIIGFIQAFNEGLGLARARQRLDAHDGVRNPDPDPRLPARGHARRTDAGGGMSRLSDRWEKCGPAGRVDLDPRRRSSSWPYLPRDSRVAPVLPLIGDFIPRTDSMVVMIVSR